jgi:hypothetical protein
MSVLIRGSSKLAGETNAAARYGFVASRGRSPAPVNARLEICGAEAAA